MKARQKRKTKAPDPFARTPRVPRRVESAARLWLDFFVDYSLGLVAHEPREPYQVTLERARDMADKGLELFQERWPKVEP